ncbi:Phosphoglucosamine mutase [bacterium HR32]|nr:Phosphoglucosamine mutase [bacterium HR32]
MARLFGTDGVRGVANETLTPEMALALGRAAAHVLGPRGSFLVGRDTRLSGPMLEAALVAGLCSAGARAVRAGVVPTPAVAYLTRLVGASAGAVISASHNPIEDNGIKFFGADGRKLTDAVEEAIEAALQDTAPRPVGVEVGVPSELVDAEERYLRFLVRHAPRVPGLRVVVDCAYGAAYRVAPELWSLLGAEVVALHDEPDGARINVRCGSTHPEALRRAVRECRAHVGFAHDGDADRVIAVDERGEVVDGDLILTVCARHLRAQGQLEPPVVVVTVMTNLGVERVLRSEGIEVVRAPVGDRYVLERMEALGATLGGEQSGHVIFRHLSTTGDGLLTAVQLVSAMVHSGKPLSQLVGEVPRYPQVLRNVSVPGRSRDRVVDHPTVRQRVEDVERRVGGRGRVLIRPSGTEPVVRVMVEHEDAERAHQLAEELVACVRKAARESPGGP